MEALLQICVKYQTDEVGASQDALAFLDNLGARAFIIWSDEAKCTSLPNYDLSRIFDKGVDVGILFQLVTKSTLLLLCSSCLSFFQVYETLTKMERNVVDVDCELLGMDRLKQGHADEDSEEDSDQDEDL